MKKAQLTVTYYIGNTQIERLSEEQLETMAKRLSDTMSLYYSAHPEEYKRLRREEEHAC